MRRDGQEQPSKHLVVTFEKHSLPTSVRAGYTYCRVKPYIPNPKRCYRCQRFGHSSRVCRSNEICAQYGSQQHVTDDCDQEAKCPNCEGRHPAYSRTCPCWKKEKEIQFLTVKENISYFEAKKRLSSNTKALFAETVRRGPAPSTASVETQVSLQDLAAPRVSPKTSILTERPAGPSGTQDKSGSTSAKAWSDSQEVASPHPANKFSKARSSAQRTPTLVPSNKPSLKEKVRWLSPSLRGYGETDHPRQKYYTWTFNLIFLPTLELT